MSVSAQLSTIMHAHVRICMNIGAYSINISMYHPGENILSVLMCRYTLLTTVPTTM